MQSDCRKISVMNRRITLNSKPRWLSANASALSPRIIWIWTITALPVCDLHQPARGSFEMLGIHCGVLAALAGFVGMGSPQATEHDNALVNEDGGTSRAPIGASPACANLSGEAQAAPLVRTRGCERIALR